MKTFQRIGVVGAVCFSLSSTVFGSGFEKSVTWSGRSAGLAGAAASSVSGGDALFYNPAGLSGMTDENEVSASFSPVQSQFEGPITTSDDKTSESTLSPLFGITSAFRVDPRITVGGGVFVSGGTNVIYEDAVSGLGASGPQDVKSQLSVLDFALGIAYELDPHWSLGASWKATYANADISTFSNNGAPAVAHFKDLTSTDWLGFRVGAQYKVKDKVGFGLNVRTPIALDLEGESELVTGGGSFDDDESTVSGTFPLQIVLGGHYYVAPEFRLFAQVDWTQYSAMEELEIDAEFAGGAVVAQDLEINWLDQWVVRLAAEYDLNSSWVLRGGYALTTAVTNSDYAKATFTPPGNAHSLVLGAGTSFNEGKILVDAAVEYSFGSAEGEETFGNNTTIEGTYAVSAFGAHLGATFKF